MGGRAAQTGQPREEIRVAFVGEARQMTPFVGDDEGTLERQQIGRDQCFEEVGIGHA